MNKSDSTDKPCPGSAIREQLLLANEAIDIRNTLAPAAPTNGMKRLLTESYPEPTRPETFTLTSVDRDTGMVWKYAPASAE